MKTNFSRAIVITYYLLSVANDVHGFTPVRTTTQTQPLTHSNAPFSTKKLSFPNLALSSQPQKIHNTNNRFCSTCIYNSNNIDNDETVMQMETKKVNPTTSTNLKKRNIQGIHPFLHKVFTSVKTSFLKPKRRITSLMAAACITLFVLFAPLSEAFAAPSGGRMGGSFGGGGSSRSSPTRSYSSPSRSYSRGYSRGYGAGYYSRPSITVVPSGNPYYYSPGGVVVRRGPSVLDVFFFGVFALVMVQAFKNFGNDTSWDEDVTSNALGNGVTVAQISVALNVPDKDSPSSILRYLNQLSRTARTDTRVGVSNLVSQGKFVISFFGFIMGKNMEHVYM